MPLPVCAAADDATHKIVVISSTPYNVVLRIMVSFSQEGFMRPDGSKACTAVRNNIRKRTPARNRIEIDLTARRSSDGQSATRMSIA
jgi:hypothetical protein